jgi:integrase
LEFRILNRSRHTRRGQEAFNAGPALTVRPLGAWTWLASPAWTRVHRASRAWSPARADPEEAGRLLARFPLFWWDHVLCLLGTGLRFGEFAGLRAHRVQVVDTRYQVGRFGSGFKPRPKSDAAIRELPLAPVIVDAIRRQLPPGTNPSALVFTGPAAVTACPVAHGRPCHAMAFAASTKALPIVLAPTLSICSCADPTIFGTASRLGWRTPASRRG